MAVSIDRVYQKVLAFANKEQRGYITPQEFNLFAHQAQMEIFEQYFYDVNQWSRQPGNDTAHSDMLNVLELKISPFEKYLDNPNTIVENQYGDIKLAQFTDFYKFLEIRVNYGRGHKTAEDVTLKEFRKYRNSPLTKPIENRPVFLHYHNVYDRIKIYPWPTEAYPGTGIVGGGGIEYDVVISYITKPVSPNWGYVVASDKALYNSTTSTDFELHASEESELVYRILAFAGIAMEKPQLTQVAAGLEQAKQQQEKQ